MIYLYPEVQFFMTICGRKDMAQNMPVFTFQHNNINIANLEESIAFYDKALGLKEVSRKSAEDGSFILAFLACDDTPYRLELTWLRDMNRPYNLGDNEFHMAFRTDDIDAARKMHEEMGAIVYENTKMGIYFIADPDGYWTEILPRKKL